MTPTQLAIAIDTFDVSQCDTGDKYLIYHTIERLKSRLNLI